MTSELHEDNDSGYLLVKRNQKVIANYPLTTLKLLKENFKKEICSSSEFDDYASLDDFIYNIYFLEFFEYYLDYLHNLIPNIIPYKKDKSKMSGDELLDYKSSDFKYLIELCNAYLFTDLGVDIKEVFNKSNISYYEIYNSTYSHKKKFKLLSLYNGFIYFLNLSINNSKLNHLINLLGLIKRSVNIDSKTEKPFFNKTKVEDMNVLFTDKNMLEHRKGLLSKFRLFQRKYLSAIAKLRKIGLPNATKKKSLELKKELNKNKDVDYKAYEIFCEYVLNKEGNEYIYDFLAGIHKNIIKGVIHKNINNNTVANIKANTKKKHHIEYFEKSKEILKSVEDKIKEHGDIIDKETKNQVERIRALFKSEQFRNMTLSFGNNKLQIKIIQDCKTIRAINKEIDKMIKEHMKQEHKDKKQKKREEVLKLIDELKETKTVKNNANTREKIVHLLGYDLLRKTKKLSQKEINTINLMHNKLNEILPKS
jgi:hypothetical protein